MISDIYLYPAPHVYAYALPKKWARAYAGVVQSKPAPQYTALRIPAVSICVI